MTEQLVSASYDIPADPPDNPFDLAALTAYLLSNTQRESIIPLGGKNILRSMGFAPADQLIIAEDINSRVIKHARKA